MYCLKKLALFGGYQIIFSWYWLIVGFPFSVSSTGSSGDDGEGGDDDSEDVIIEDKVGDTGVDPDYGALAPVMVPEIFPRVPLLCVHRNPVFPRFVKMLEVHIKQILPEFNLIPQWTICVID